MRVHVTQRVTMIDRSTPQCMHLGVENNKMIPLENKCDVNIAFNLICKFTVIYTYRFHTDTSLVDILILG